MLNFVEADRARNEDRVIELTNNKAHIKKSDPYGLWNISLDRGRLPDALRGQYTTPTQAEKALSAYLKLKGRLPE